MIAKVNIYNNLYSNIVLLIFTLLLLIIKPSTSLGQVTNPGPNSAAYSKFVDIPVSHFTGVPNISIPIYTISEGDINIPIELNYHSGGFKVYEDASWVGLGWSLHAGGAITRQIRGFDDLKDLSIANGRYSKGNEYCQNFIDPTSSSVLPSDLDCRFYSNYGSPISLATYLGNDEQHDIFYFSANGITGKFILHNGEVRLLSKSNVKVEPITDISNSLESCSGFIITSSNGMKYYYEITESQTRTETGAESQTTAWYMSKIISPTNFSVSFKYKSCKVKTPNRSQEIFVGNKKEPDEISDLYIYEKYIEKITFSTGYVQFITSSREDYGLDGLGRKLSQISIVNGINQTFNLRYNYFQSENTNNNYSTKRLKLQEIIKQVVGSNTGINWRMKYYGDEDDPNTNFRLPNKSSLMQDHWGYYNGKTINDENNTLIPIIPNLPGIHIDFKGANREADGEYMHACMLKSIAFPMGYTTLFEYEPNDYKRTNASYITSSELKTVNSFEANTVGGGVRIKRIITSESGIQLIKRFEYKDDDGESSGIFHGGIVYYNTLFSKKRNIDGTITTTPVIIRSSYGVKSQSTNGVHVGYSKVTEHINGDENGKKEFYFYNKSNDKYPIWNFTNSIISKYSPWEWNCGDYKLMPEIDFKSFTQNNHSDDPVGSAGLSKLIIDYAKEENLFKEVSKKEFIYTTHLISKIKNIQVIPVEGMGSTTSTSINRDIIQDVDGPIKEIPPSHEWGLLYYFIFEYPEYQYWSQLDTTYTTLDGLTTEESFLYEDSYKMLREKSTQNSLGDNIVMKCYYPFDYSEGIESCKNLVDRNIIGNPIKIEHYNNNQRVNGSVTLFNKYGLPKAKYAYIPSLTSISNNTHNPNEILPDDGTYVEMERFSYEPNRLRLSEYWQKNKPLESYFWDKPHLHPIAHAINASFEELNNAVSGSMSTINNNFIMDEDRLRNNLPQAFVTTFNYKPGVGLISSTNANGISSYTNYDEWGRQQTTLNNNKFITSLSEYSFNEQTSSIVPQPTYITATKSVISDPSIEYIYQVDMVPGADIYIWTIPSEGGIIDGESTNSIKVRYNKHLSNSKVSVVAHNANGNSQQVSVDAQPCEFIHNIDEINFKNYRVTVLNEVHVLAGTIITATAEIKKETSTTGIQWDIPSPLILTMTSAGIDDPFAAVYKNREVKITIPEDTPNGTYVCYAYERIDKCEDCNAQKFSFFIVVGDEGTTR